MAFGNLSKLTPSLTNYRDEWSNLDDFIFSISIFFWGDALSFQFDEKEVLKISRCERISNSNFRFTSKRKDKFRRLINTSIINNRVKNMDFP